MAMNRAERRRAEREQRKAAATMDPGALFTEALAHHNEGRVAEALKLAERALSADKSHVDALQLAGMAAIQLRDTDKALRSLADKTRLDPDNPHGHVNHGAALQMAGDLDQAAECFRRAIALDAGMADAHTNLGVTLRDLSRFAEAEETMRRALDISPGDARLMVSLASVVQARGRIDEAITLYDQVLAINPGHEDTIYKRSLCHFAKGDFARGQQDHESRWAAETFDSKWRDYSEAPWRGEPLSGKRILVWAEQGVGDHIIFLGSLPALIAEGGSCVFQCDQRLVTLFARSLPAAKIVPDKSESQYPDIDFQIPAASFALQRRIELPGQYPLGRYLQADPERSAEIKARLADQAPGRPVIGIAWRSSRVKAGPWKSMPLDLWGPILSRREALFVNLQYGETDDEIAAARAATGADIFTDPHIDRFNDFEGLAALIDSLDLVITTSNVTAHFAGALGKTCLLALQVTPLWYWGMKETPIPLYSSVESFWQSTENAWGDVVGEIAARLDDHLANSEK